MKRVTIQPETEEGRQRQEIVRAATDFRSMLETAGWQRVWQLLENRPPVIGISGLEDPEEGKDYWRGRLHECDWIITQIREVVAAADEILEQEREQKAVSIDARRRFLGKGMTGDPL